MVLTALTWNIEGVKNNVFMLKDTLQLKKPSLVFLSESQIFQSDIDAAMVHVQGEYCYHLNSDDSHDPELSLVKDSRPVYHRPPS